MKKVDVLQKFISVGTLNKFQKHFEDSLIIQLYWENSIDLVEGKPIEFDKKINFTSLIRKFIGKKLRDFFARIKNLTR